MAKRGLEPEGTRKRIRSTAAALFTENGVHASSLADIAQAAKLSKGTLYYHYPSKEDLVLEIADHQFADITEAIYSWIDGINFHTPAREAIRALAAGLRGGGEASRLYFALLSEALREPGELRRLLRAKQKEWAVMIEVGALKLPGGDAQRFRAYSRGFLAMLDGFSLHMLINEELDESLLFQIFME